MFNKLRNALAIMGILSLLSTSVALAGSGNLVSITWGANGVPTVTITGDAVVNMNGIVITTNPGVQSPHIAEAIQAPAPKAQVAESAPTSGVPIENGSCEGPRNDGSYGCKGGKVLRPGRMDMWEGFFKGSYPALCAKLDLRGDTVTLRCEAGTDLSMVDKLTWRKL